MGAPPCETPGARLLMGVARDKPWEFDAEYFVQVPLQLLLTIEKHLTGDEAAAQGILRAMSEEAAGNPGRRSRTTYLNLAGACATAAGEWNVAQALLASIDAQPVPQEGEGA